MNAFGLNARRTLALCAGETSWDEQRWLSGGLSVFNMVLFGDFDFALFRSSPPGLTQLQ
jgi:hypothetical protein